MPFPAATLRPWCSLLLVSCASSPSSAPEPWSGFLVAGAASLPEYEGARDQRIVPLVISRLTRAGREIEIEGLQMRVDLCPDEELRAGPALGFTLPRVPEDDSFVEASNLAAEAGAFLGFRKDWDLLPEGSWAGTLTTRRDVTGVHDGTLTTAEVELFFAANYMLRFGLGFSTTYASDNYQQTFYSVAPSSGPGAFRAEAGFRDTTAELFSILSFSPSWGVFVRGAYTRLIGDAGRSPVVREEGDRDQWFLGLGVFWRF